MSFPQLLTSRRLGEPGAQGKIEEALNQKIENALVNDCFHSRTIKLPKDSEHRISRCQDFVAVLSVNDTDKKVALWSLNAQCKLWDLEITKYYLGSEFISCKVSEQGMILVDEPSTGNKMILLDGKRSGTLPNILWISIRLLGKRILGSWLERRYPNHPDPRWLPENTDIFFGEYDEKGNSVNRYQLDCTEGRETHISVCDENYWVKLSYSGTNGLASIIEIVDRVVGKIKTCTLPLIPYKEQFSTACLVQDRLFYGKSIIVRQDNSEIKCKPTICIFDLVKGKIIEEFPVGPTLGTLKNLVATQHYAAWLECENGEDDPIKYLDLLNKKIKVATTISYDIGDRKIALNIFRTTLSVIYAESFGAGGHGSFWRRKVIDLTNGELKCDVRYKGLPWGDCSLENGNLLITDFFSSPSRMYIESFADERTPNEESKFRDKPKAQANFSYGFRDRLSQF